MITKLRENQTFRDVLYLLSSSVFISFFLLGSGSLASFDEAFYAIVSKNVANSMDFVHLTLFGNSFYDKPPLYMWVSALFFKTFGIHEFSVRLLSALCGVGTVLVTYFLGRFLSNRLVGLVSAGILMSTRDFIHYSRWGVLDITHLFFFTLAVFFFLSAKSKPHRYYGFWIAVACAILTKGLIISLGFAILGIYSLLHRDLGFLKRSQFWLGLLLALILILPWHILNYLENPDEFITGYIIQNYLSRTSRALDGHAGNIFYYIRVIVHEYRPWMVLLPLSIPYCLFCAFKANSKKVTVLPVLWIAVILGFFTFFVKTKLAWYVLPMYPALSLSIGFLAAKLIKNRIHERILKSIFIVVLMLHIPTSTDFIQDHSHNIKSLAKTVQRYVPANGTVFLYRYYEQPAAYFYWERTIQYIENPEILHTYLTTAGHTTFLVTQEKNYPRIKDELDKHHFQIIDQSTWQNESLFFLKKRVD